MIFQKKIVLKYFDTIDTFKNNLEKFESSLRDYARYNFIEEDSNLNYSDTYVQYKLYYTWNNKDFVFCDMCNKWGDDDYVDYSRFYDREFSCYPVIDTCKMISNQSMIDRKVKIEEVIFNRINKIKNDVKSMYNVEKEDFLESLKRYIKNN